MIWLYVVWLLHEPDDVVEPAADEALAHRHDVAVGCVSR